MTVYREIYIESPVGYLQVVSAIDKIVAVHFAGARKRKNTSPEPILTEAKKQFEKYFSGKLRTFDLPLYFSGTSFQQRVWNMLEEIPFGETISYLDLAKRLGDMKCIRAAAGANGKNPLAIIVPCHRVIGSDGKLVGYGGELWRKDWLIKHESKVAGKYFELF